MGELVGADSHLKFDGIALRGKFFEHYFWISVHMMTEHCNHDKIPLTLHTCIINQSLSLSLSLCSWRRVYARNQLSISRIAKARSNNMPVVESLAKAGWIVCAHTMFQGHVRTEQGTLDCTPSRNMYAHVKFSTSMAGISICCYSWIRRKKRRKSSTWYRSESRTHSLNVN